MIDEVATEDAIEIVVYTDPLCCWSAALQSHIDRLKGDLNVEIRYCLAGMVPDWKSFTDPLNSVTKPIQMGPVWMEAKYITGTAIDESIWVKDPPTSSFPACIAVKTAGLQSKEAGDKMLFALRDAVMSRGLNISKEDVLLKIAKGVASEFPDLLDLARFKKEYNQGESRDELRKDLNEVKQHRIGRFPTLKFRKKGQKTLMITGYRTYEELLSVFSHLH